MRLLSVIAVAASIASAADAFAQEPGDLRKGRGYAQQNCAECHAVLPTDSSSPRLGLATFKAIANTPGMTGTALAVWLQTPHPTMPNLMVPTTDRDNVIAYIISLRDDAATK